MFGIYIPVVEAFGIVVEMIGVPGSLKQARSILIDNCFVPNISANTAWIRDDCRLSQSD